MPPTSVASIPGQRKEPLKARVGSVSILDVLQYGDDQGQKTATGMDSAAVWAGWFHLGTTATQQCLPVGSQPSARSAHQASAGQPGEPGLGAPFALVPCRTAAGSACSADSPRRPDFLLARRTAGVARPVHAREPGRASRSSCRAEALGRLHAVKIDTPVRPGHHRIRELPIPPVRDIPPDFEPWLPLITHARNEEPPMSRHSHGTCTTLERTLSTTVGSFTVVEPARLAGRTNTSLRSSVAVRRVMRQAA